ncbi:MAG TPA: indolepyruvate oxidoreductase subunit beta family protein [Anaerolineae bacterium]
MTVERPFCLLLGALGGQGGGVLTDWLVEAARAAGYLAQATSIPGVAQRTGATTYYFELFPDPDPPADPVFCLFPSAGDVDLAVALEPTEAGRALERGYVTDRTTVVTTTERIYSTAEKSVAGDGTMAVTPILEALARTAKAVISIDAAYTSGSQANAVIFGAIIGSGVLPLNVTQGRAAIEARELAVGANLAGFETGLELARNPTVGAPPAPVLQHDPPPPRFEVELALLPTSLRPLVGHGLARLVDYQDEAYARRYLARLEPILAADEQGQEFRLTVEVARRLAAWMSYEDTIRVAQLKTRPGRLARIRAEVGAQPGEPVTITDFLNPGRNELLSVLPAPIARLIPAGDGKNGKVPGIPLAWPTSSPWGYAALRFLAALRRVRPYTEAFAQEQQAIEAWLDAVASAARVDYELGCQVAQLAVWARGYGQVRSRGLARLARLFANWSQRLAIDVDAVKAEVTASLYTARHAPEG